MKNDRSIRVNYFIGFILIAALLGMAAYLEFVKGINPCPLCILQRLMMAFLGVVFFFGMLLRLKTAGQLLLGLLGLLTSLGGMALSGRQVWLQHIPQENAGECGVSLVYMFKIFPFTEALKHVWRGGTECSQHGWMFWHLSLAEWSLIWFGIFFLFIMLQQKRALTG